jgi:hypothetical protein
MVRNGGNKRIDSFAWLQRLAGLDHQEVVWMSMLYVCDHDERAFAV